MHPTGCMTHASHTSSYINRLVTKPPTSRGENGFSGSLSPTLSHVSRSLLHALGRTLICKAFL